ncbi:hypothetical protein [Saccharothrix carnea]|uniref:hypothetical protein n=1 Tax=Saccharothrix carnea TaxID=1280637 RepID=UPI0011B20A84|nr:hypothetical protein [Saccharothrix carnea]
MLSETKTEAVSALGLTSPSQARSQMADQAFIAIQAKRVDNNELLTAMSDHLINRYLIPVGRNHGIFLASWITPEQRPRTWSRSTFPTAEELLDRLKLQASDALTRRIHAVGVCSGVDEAVAVR